LDTAGQGSRSHRLTKPIVRASRRTSVVSCSSAESTLPRRIHTLYTIAVILLVAWLLGFVGIYTIGSFVHVLLVVAIVLFLVGLVSGRRALG
jgi:uncharacterized membrane protein YtjA (UPF0391 family)